MNFAAAVDRVVGELTDSVAVSVLSTWETARTAQEVIAAAMTTLKVERQELVSWIGEMDLDGLRIGLGVWRNSPCR